jgi:sec-independent protein translocase protein TatA
MMNLRPTEILIILFVLVLLFGAKRLPDTARAIGDSLKIFKKTVRDEDREQQGTPQPEPQQSQLQIAATAEPLAAARVDAPTHAEH